jgi:hypothetical protein
VDAVNGPADYYDAVTVFLRDAVPPILIVAGAVLGALLGRSVGSMGR